MSIIKIHTPIFLVYQSGKWGKSKDPAQAFKNSQCDPARPILMMIFIVPGNFDFDDCYQKITVDDFARAKYPEGVIYCESPIFEPYFGIAQILDRLKNMKLNVTTWIFILMRFWGCACIKTELKKRC
jgi:hypothetical protein